MKKTRVLLKVYNTLERKLANFTSIHQDHVGIYVCGPTVYGEVHMGNIRTFLGFDIMQRYLKYLGYKVRYVRNITDVGHLTEQAEDKIEQAAKLLRKEPMELIDFYIRAFHHTMDSFNIQPPTIEPRATTHITEQIELISKILEKGFGYVSKGSVYFDLEAYEKVHNYGQLSGRKTKELYSHTRALSGQDAKHSALDFALWKQATETHLMQWPSPWSRGVPGWHLECSAMSIKYLGEKFDIYGGGMDLKFPHHECSIAQSIAATETHPAKYWLYVNMLTLNGEKMSKSAGNILTPSNILENKYISSKANGHMILRFFMLQAHYRSPLNFSKEALKAAEKGYFKLMNSLRVIKNIQYTEENQEHIENNIIDEIILYCKSCEEAMLTDFNTALALSALFSLSKKIQAIHHHTLPLSALDKACFTRLKETYISYTEDILGLRPPHAPNGLKLLEEIIELYKESKRTQQHELIDKMRRHLQAQGIALQDMPGGKVQWSYKE